MHRDKNEDTSLALFCKVVDNYGDIGICWRLSRQLQQEHGIAVSLWVDDLQCFQRMCPEVDPDADLQLLQGVSVHHWRDQDGIYTAADVADIVIEFFACDIPEGYIAAMAQCDLAPVWLNLEGLTAEAWVEGCHTLPSPHPRLPLTKHFFFPGFTRKAGGLLRESAVEVQRQQFQADPAAVAAFLAQMGLTPAEMAALKISLFCYPHAPVAALFNVWQNNAAAITCLVPQGVASEAVEAFLGAPAIAGAVRTSGALTVRVVPFVAQADYDRLLWACDLNFVRGEDSFVRAQWAARPFIWHIYPQDENLHHVKLRAFLQRYCAADGAADGAANGVAMDSLKALTLRWNGADSASPQASADWASLWSELQAAMPELAHRSAGWQQQMQENGDMAGNLLKFARRLRSAALSGTEKTG